MKDSIFGAVGRERTKSELPSQPEYQRINLETESKEDNRIELPGPKRSEEVETKTLGEVTPIPRSKTEGPRLRIPLRNLAARHGVSLNSRTSLEPSSLNALSLPRTPTSKSTPGTMKGIAAICVMKPKLLNICV